MQTVRFISGAAAAAALIALTLLSARPAFAQAASCSVESIKFDAAKNVGVGSAISAAVNTNRCSSLRNVLRQIMSGAIKAGRKLEGDRPVDVADASKQLADARANPEIQAAISSELKHVTDPNQRLLLEAVVMHDKLQLLARDLLLQQLDAQGRK